MPMSMVTKSYGENEEKPTDVYLVDTRPMIQVVKDISNISAMNAMHNIRLTSEVNQLTSIVNQQNTLLRNMASDMNELKKVIGLNNHIKSSKNILIKYVEDWDVLDQRLSSNMQMIVFNWYNSDVNQSANNVPDDVKRKVGNKKSKLHALVKRLEKLGNNNGLILNQRPNDIDKLAAWKIEAKEFSSKCYDLARESNEKGKYVKVRGNDIKYTQMKKILDKIIGLKDDNESTMEKAGDLNED